MKIYEQAGMFLRKKVAIFFGLLISVANKKRHAKHCITGQSEPVPDEQVANGQDLNVVTARRYGNANAEVGRPVVNERAQPLPDAAARVWNVPDGAGRPRIDT